MVTVDYAYYAQEFGGQLSSEAFYSKINSAQALVDSMIMGRAVSTALLPQVKNAICAVLDEEVRTANGIVSSASNDGYSETYAVKQSRSESLYSVANIYLARTGLLFRGGLARC